MWPTSSGGIGGGIGVRGLSPESQITGFFAPFSTPAPGTIGTSAGIRRQAEKEQKSLESPVNQLRRHPQSSVDSRRAVGV